MSIERYIENMKVEAALLEEIHAKFPDLQITHDRWKKMYMQAASANSQVTDVLLQHNCGCCPDSPLEVKPCLPYKGKMIYGVPFAICIGEGTHAGYDRWDSDWREKILKHGFPQSIIDQLESRYQESLIDAREANEE